MVVKMMKWSPWQPIWAFKKFQVKVRPRKLEGFDWLNKQVEEPDEGEEREKVAMLEMKWKGPNHKMGLPALRWKQQKDVSAEKTLRKGFDIIEWKDEFERVCSFSFFQKDNSFSPWDVSFNLLYGLKGEPFNKLTSMGTVSLNIAELASQILEEPLIETKLPMALQVDGVASKATLLISVGFIEIRNEGPDMVRDASVAEREDGFFRKFRDLTGYRSKSKKKAKKSTQLVEEASEDGGVSGSGDHTDESTTFDSEESKDENNLGPTQQEFSSTVSTPASLASGLTRSPSCDNSYDSASKGGFWKKRRLSFRSSKKKLEPLIKKSTGAEEQPFASAAKPEGLEGKSSLESECNAEEILVESWEEKDLVSRDGDAKLQAEIFFASIDQRSEKAAGESACTALVAVIANWLQTNRGVIPTKSEFDDLLVEGSLEWQKLCNNEAYIQRFPDKHFDLETVLEANLRPFSVMPNKSFVGFFCPERFESLKGAMSFDEIWDEISRSMEAGGEPLIYVVSWNDHFFLLKVEDDAYYIIDSLGERLFEGCNQAYVLKFSDKTKIYRLLREKPKDGAKEMTGLEKQDDDKNGDNGEKGDGCEELICSGKESCREYFKRFLASIPLKELEMEEKKSIEPSIFLHQKLQIEFHFCIDSSSISCSRDSDSS